MTPSHCIVDMFIGIEYLDKLGMFTIHQVVIWIFHPPVMDWCWGSPLEEVLPCHHSWKPLRTPPNGAQTNKAYFSKSKICGFS